MNVWEQLRLPDPDEQLAQFEAALKRSVVSDQPFLTEVASHLINAGGKRLRPALSIAATIASGHAITADIIQGAVSVELVHLGSLYHDDVIDDAAQRRGVSSVNVRYGNLVAILAGDFLMARASELGSDLGAEMAGLLASTISELCQGEVSQLSYAFSPSRTEQAYLEAVSGKTASLLATSARVGTLVSGASREEIEAFTTFGRAFGMAFQIWDDVNDIVCTDEELGKPACHDMVEGTYTLPVIRALANESVGSELNALLGRPLEGPECEKARQLILSTDAMASSIAEARRWADISADSLKKMPAGLDDQAAETRMTLSGLAHRLIDELSTPEPA